MNDNEKEVLGRIDDIPTMLMVDYIMEGLSTKDMLTAKKEGWSPSEMVERKISNNVEQSLGD